MPFSRLTEVEKGKGVYREGDLFIKAKLDERNMFRFDRYRGRTKAERKRNAVAHAEAHIKLYETLIRAGLIHPETQFAVVGKEGDGHVRISLIQPAMTVPEYGRKFDAIADKAEAQRLRERKAAKIDHMRNMMERLKVTPHNDWQHEFNWGKDANGGLYYVDSQFLLDQLPSELLKKKTLLQKAREKFKK